MTQRPKQRVITAAVALGTGLAALACVPHVPALRSLERALTGWLAATVHKPPFDLTGTGDIEESWTLVRDMPPPETPVPPSFLAITDDPAGIFENNPPSAADWAVILDNLYREGHRSLAISPTLAWEDPDPIAFAAVDSQLERFRPAIAGMPVVRGITPQPIPPAFLRYSLPVSRVDGDFRALPIVNQPAVAKASLGRTHAVAAFTRLESEQAPEFADPARPAVVPLLARWDDRIVFALPLAATMVRFSVGPDDLTIRPGREIRLGSRGPVIPIDLHGRTTVRPLAEPLPARPAEDVINTERKSEALTPPDPAPLIVRDDRTRLTPDDRETSRRLADVLMALAAAPRGGNSTVLARPHTAFELALITVLALVGGALAGLPKSNLRTATLAGLPVAVPVLLLVLARFGVWQPAVATCVTPLAALLTILTRKHAGNPTTAAAMTELPVAVPSPAVPPPAPPTARKRSSRAKVPATQPADETPPPRKRAAAKKKAPTTKRPSTANEPPATTEPAAVKKTTRRRKPAADAASPPADGDAS